MRRMEGEFRNPSGCAIAAVISRNGERMSGEKIIESMKPMHERSNGLGGGFAGYGTAMVLSYFVGQKKYPIDYPLKDIGIYVLAALVLFIAMAWTGKLSSPALTLVLNSVLILAFCALIVKKDLPLRSLPVVGKRFSR